MRIIEMKEEQARRVRAQQCRNDVHEMYNVHEHVHRTMDLQERSVPNNLLIQTLVVNKKPR